MSQQSTANERRAQPRSSPQRWQTALTAIAPNKILIRGYPLDEMMGRLGFAEAVYLLLMGELPPGFGPPFPPPGPRPARLFQRALELELEGEHVGLIRVAERALDAHKDRFERPLPVTVAGAIAPISADLGFAYELGNAIFLISRLPGLIAHAHDERTRQQPMRQIDPKDHDYDGARDRRLPEGRK